MLGAYTVYLGSDGFILSTITLLYLGLSNDKGSEDYHPRLLEIRIWRPAKKRFESRRYLFRTDPIAESYTGSPAK